MTAHIEWLEAKRTTATFLLPGQEVVEDSGIEIAEQDGIGIALSEDDVVVLTGEPGAIRSLCMRIIRQTILAEVKLDQQRAKQAKELKKKVEAAL